MFRKCKCCRNMLRYMNVLQVSQNVLPFRQCVFHGSVWIYIMHYTKYEFTLYKYLWSEESCLFIFFKDLFILCIWVHCSCLQTLQKRASDLIIDGCGCWELNSGSLEEQSVLLTAEPAPQLFLDWRNHTDDGTLLEGDTLMQRMPSTEPLPHAFSSPSATLYC